VTVDGKYLGEAPLELHFAHYGERRFRISKRGYNTLDSVVPVEAPWYGAFPFDVFCEVVVPVWRTDYRSQSFTLTPRTEAAGLTDAELRRREEEAVGRARALARWVPGDPIPGASGPASSPDSRPTPAPPASKP
jgi:hypothetical protein